MLAKSATLKSNAHKTRTAVTLIASLMALVALFGTHARAATIVYDNINSSTPLYQLGGNWFGSFGNQYAITATSFTPSATGLLDSIDVGITQGLGLNSFTLRLSPDVSGLPSAPIWQSTATPAAGWGSLLSLTGIGGPVISSGQQYWLEAVAPVSPPTLHNWFSNNQGDNGPVIATGTYVANAARFSLRVGVLAVPEPGSCFLALASIVCAQCAFARRCER